MSGLNANSTASTSWFTEALDDAPLTSEIVVDEARIVYRSWGAPGADDDVVLIHGGAAHGRWWDHIAPLLSATRRVVALDLAGHGESDHRTDYTLDGWAREVLAVIDDAGLGARPLIVGHSLGGLIGLRAAALANDVSGVIVIDSPVGQDNPEFVAAQGEFSMRPHTVYPTVAAAIDRFRPVPSQGSIEVILRHVAETSIREVEGGWTWRFDTGIFPIPQTTLGLISDLECPFAFFRAEYGIIGEELVSWLHGNDDIDLIYIDLPSAGHAPMLDQPLALVTGIRGVVSAWARTRAAGPLQR